MSRPEIIAARVLLVGGLVGVTLMVLGVLATAVHHQTGVPPPAERVQQAREEARSTDTMTSLGQIARGLRHRPIDPVAVAALGIVLLLGTPFAAVVGAGLAFYAEGDTRFAAVAAMVVGLLVLAFALGGV